MHDVEKATYGDLSSQFYLTEEDIGKNRAEACVAKLSELNEYVQVEALSGELTEEIIAKFKVVVLVNRPEEEIERISELCRKHEVKFMVADIAGLFARVFVDVGSKHTVTDGNGERIRMYAIGNISQGDRTIVEVVDGETHDLDDGDFVQFSMVEGMTELNELKEPVRVGSKNRISFYVDVNSKDFHEYTKNGYVTEVKIPKDVSHKPYKEEVKAPTLVENGDYVHFTRPSTLHTCFLVMNDFRKNHAGALPKVYTESVLRGKNDLHILAYCYNTPHTTREIAEELQIKPSTYFRQSILARLVDQGLLYQLNNEKTALFQSNPNKVFLKSRQ